MTLSDWFQGIRKRDKLSERGTARLILFGMREKLCEMWNTANLSGTI